MVLVSATRNQSSRFSSEVHLALEQLASLVNFPVLYVGIGSNGNSTADHPDAAASHPTTAVDVGARITTEEDPVLFITTHRRPEIWETSIRLEAAGSSVEQGKLTDSDLRLRMTVQADSPGHPRASLESTVFAGSLDSDNTVWAWKWYVTSHLTTVNSQ